jgi:hypothetical protein
MERDIGEKKNISVMIAIVIGIGHTNVPFFVGASRSGRRVDEDSTARNLLSYW